MGEAPSWPGQLQLRRPKERLVVSRNAGAKSPWRLHNRTSARSRTFGGPIGGRKAARPGARGGGPLLSLERKAEPPSWAKKTGLRLSCEALHVALQPAGSQDGLSLPPDTASFPRCSPVVGEQPLPAAREAGWPQSPSEKHLGCPLCWKARRPCKVGRLRA